MYWFYCCVMIHEVLKLLLSMKTFKKILIFFLSTFILVSYQDHISHNPFRFPLKRSYPYSLSLPFYLAFCLLFAKKNEHVKISSSLFSFPPFWPKFLKASFPLSYVLQSKQADFLWAFYHCCSLKTFMPMLQNALEVTSHCLLNIYLLRQKDTMAIKKRSSRTRRIRPVSTRLSEFLCLNLH